MTIVQTKTGPGILTIGEAASLTNFQSQCTSTTLTPKVDTDDAIIVLSGETKGGERTETWNLSGTLLNDWGVESGLVQWLFEHRGQDLPFEFQPLSTYDQSFTGTLTVEAVEIGGDAGKAGDHDFEFALVGNPILGPVATTPTP